MRIEVLDHGYVEHVESWGSDERIVEAARQSVSGGFVSWEPYEKHPRGDLGLLETLYTKGHTTPFEMAGASFEAQAPIFVFREWHRHRTQSYSEASARYAPLPDLNYVPTVERLLATAGANRQAQGTGAVLDADSARLVQHKIKKLYADAQVEYEDLLRLGAPKELARVVLPVGRYSRMRASANLLNWIRFLRLREDAAAQLEIRLYAEAIHALLREKFPRTMALYEKEKHA